MSRFFGQSKTKSVPKPTLNDTVVLLNSRLETVNKQIADIDRGFNFDKQTNIRSIQLLFRFTCL